MKFNFKSLSKRERYAVYAAGCAVVLFILLQLVFFPIAEKRRRLVRSIDVKTKMLQEMTELKSEYDTLNRQTDLSKINFNKKYDLVGIPKPKLSIKPNNSFNYNDVVINESLEKTFIFFVRYESYFFI